MSLQFEYVWVLMLLWLVPAAGILWFWMAARRDRRLDLFMSDTMRRKLGPPAARWRLQWQLSLLLAGLFLLILALARPQWGMREERVYQRGRNLLVALDVSRSMLARDLHPNRLGRAKADILDLVQALNGDRIGLLTFRGKAVLLCPLTTDYAFFLQILENADIDSAPAGETSLGDALRKAMSAFESDSGGQKAIVLISDGEDLAGQALAAAEEAKKQGIVVFTVGLGNPAGARIPGEKSGEFMNYQGKEVVTKLDHEVLRKIADITGGYYVPVGMHHADLGQLYRDHLRRMASNEKEESIQRRHIERYQYLLLPAFLCLLAVTFFSRGQIVTTRPPPLKKKTTPTAGTALPLLLIALFALPGAREAAATTNKAAAVPAVRQDATNNPVAAKAPPAGDKLPTGRAGGRLGQRLYQQGKYEEAAEAYRAAAGTAPGQLQNDLLYNTGCALYKARQYEAAADAFRDVMQREGADIPSAAYNQGVAWNAAAAAASNSANAKITAEEERAERLDEAGKALQCALRAAPDEPVIRSSLADVTARLPDTREQAKVARLMRQYGKLPPGALADITLMAQRALVTAIPPAFATNPLPAQIARLEELADVQTTNTDLLIPLKGQLMAALEQARQQPGGGAGAGGPANPTNQQSIARQIAELDQYIEITREKMRLTAMELRDLDPQAAESASISESALYNLWKLVAGYPQLLREDILQQTNLIDRTATRSPQSPPALYVELGHRQNEAQSLTHRFVERFTAEVPEGGIPAPAAQPAGTQGGPATTPDAATSTSANTNAPLLSAEDRARILDLAQQAIAAQQAAETAITNRTPDVSLDTQRHSYYLLTEIEKLLPKQPSQSQPQEQQQEQRQQEQEQQQQEQPQQQPQQQSQPQEQKPEPKEQPSELKQEELRKLLEKARQREKEHQEELRRHDQYMPLPPIGRDW